MPMPALLKETVAGKQDGFSDPFSVSLALWGSIPLNVPGYLRAL